MSVAGLIDNLPPHNLEAERGVLGCILMDCSTMLDISRVLKPTDFYREAHVLIYRTMLELWESTQQIDIITLCDLLTSRDQYKKLGGDEMLMGIANSVPHAANYQAYAAIVREKSWLRQIIQKSTETIRDAYSQQYTASQVQETSEQRIFGLNQSMETGQVYNMDQAVQIYSQIMEKRMQGEIDGLTVGFPDLDELILGMRPKQFLVLAARPGAGKTSLAMDIAWHVSTTIGKRVLFVSLEMAIEELTERLTSSIAGIDSKRLKDPWLLNQLSHAENDRVMQAMGQIREAKMQINDCVGQSVSQIASLARRTMTRDGLDLLVIDYLGKIRKPEGRNMNTNDQITYISNGLKELSGELRIPVLCLHQLNRDCVKEGVRPQMHHLRDSGSIEQDADGVWLIHNAIPKNEPTGQVELIVDKNRGGATGIVYLTYEKPFTRFSSSTPPQVY